MKSVKKTPICQKKVPSCPTVSPPLNGNNAPVESYKSDRQPDHNHPIGLNQVLLFSAIDIGME
ncbi:hypothetical protein NFHSH190041_10160 [Shewanella sp. NFH-SH190041]|uniref:hypothetical protein n=1 Tax=Shewanella sp. NFH-SH190041 TaxID=2950245 RepID=UPI0021C4C7F8|nr:hypothetical protein [Shewanella sp. NFH-SH190041]BDM63564.1 hypothetical protein NFHSH190041_10160 [Shewanella sp. NFH-SH190041]